MVFFFDFFGVIISEIVPAWLERFFKPEEASVIKERIFNPADIGLISEEEAYGELSKITGIPPKQIQAEWDSMVEVNTELVDYIHNLKQHYPVYLLTNAMSTHIRRILDKHSLFSAFDRVFISSEMKRIKPDPAFFTSVAAALGADPSAAVMIDDNPRNIQGAKQAGLNGIVYRNNGQLFEEIGRFINSELKFNESENSELPER